MKKKAIKLIILGLILIILGILVSIIPEPVTIGVWPSSDIFARSILGKILVAVGVFLIVFGFKKR